MQLITFDRNSDIPIVDAKIRGPRAPVKLRLVFDTGSARTLIDTSLIEHIGYSAGPTSSRLIIQGPVGEHQEGHFVTADNLILFGKRFLNISLGAIDFDTFGHFEINGVLGFDVIKQLRLAMDGPAGELKVY